MKYEIEKFLKILNDVEKKSSVTTDENIQIACGDYAEEIGLDREDRHKIYEWFVGQILEVSLEEARKHDIENEFWDKKIEEKIEV